MKPVQVMLDEALLKRLDADPEVKRSGRSAVLRRAATAYLRTSRAQRIKAAYARAYGEGAALGADFDDWEAEGAWPE